MVPYQYSMHTSCVNEQVHARVFNPTTATTTTEINLVFILIFFLKFQKKNTGIKLYMTCTFLYLSTSELSTVPLGITFGFWSSLFKSDKLTVPLPRLKGCS